MVGKPSTLPVDQIKAMYASGMRPERIAEAIGRNRSTVYMWMLRHGVHKAFSRPLRAIDAALEQAKANPAPTDKWTLKKGQIHPDIVKALEAIPQPYPSSRESAKRSGYASSTVRHWLAGKRHPNDDCLEDLLQTLKWFAERSQG